MKQKSILQRKLHHHLAHGLLLLASGAAAAQTISPNANIPLREFENRSREQAVTPTPRSADNNALAVPAGNVPSLQIRDFHFEGAKLIEESRLREALQKYVNQNLAAEQLNQLSQTLVALYLRAGNMARVRIQAVDVASGRVVFGITELRIGQLRAEWPPNDATLKSLADRFLTDASLSPGMPVPLERLQTGVTTLNARPGVAAAIAIDPGTQPDQVDIAIRLNPRPVLAGQIYLDNHGYRDIGQARLGAKLRFDNSFGLTERLALNLETTSASDYLSPALYLPLTDNLAWGGEASYANFKSLNNLTVLTNYQGYYRNLRTYLQQTLPRIAGFDLGLNYALERTTYHSQGLSMALNSNVVTEASLSLNAKHRSNRTFSFGNLEIDRGHSIDQIAQTQMPYWWRARWQLIQEYGISDGTLSLRSSGQLANRTLDGSRKFSLGGPDAIRAFPVGEASGDAGWLATVEWRQPVAETLDSRIFLDTGHIKEPNSASYSRYSLSGIGTGITWRLPENFRLSTDYAYQVGSNPRRPVQGGADADNRDNSWRLWLALSKSF